MSLPPLHLGCRTVGAVTALLLVVFCTPDSLRASCGDYLVPHVAHSASVLALLGDHPEQSQSIPNAPTGPCSGPTCTSRLPLLPIQSVTDAPTRGFELAASTVWMT